MVKRNKHCLVSSCHRQKIDKSKMANVLLFVWFIVLFWSVSPIQKFSPKRHFRTVVKLLIEVALLISSENQFYISIAEQIKACIL